MPLHPSEMILENTEGYSDFNIDPEWYKHRKPGLSVVIRCFGEERWIGPCLESMLPLCDEILVTMTEKEGDRTEEIVKSFRSPKLRLLRYPFSFAKVTDRTPKRKFERIMYPQFPGDASVHIFSYYTNWGMSKTRFSHVAPKWDADMWLLPRFGTPRFHDLIVSKSVVNVTGFNVATKDFKFLSKLWPIQGPEPRFFKVDQYRFFYGEVDSHSYQGPVHLAYPGRWYQFPVQQAQGFFNTLFRRDVYYPRPVFLHTKLLSKQFKQERFIGAEMGGKLDPLMVPGREMPVLIPEFVWKTPEVYLGLAAPKKEEEQGAARSFDKKEMKEALDTITKRKGELT